MHQLNKILQEIEKIKFEQKLIDETEKNKNLKKLQNKQRIDAFYNHFLKMINGFP